MDIFGGIDGTGTSDDTLYAKEFAKSHVRTLHSQWTTPYSLYDRGPSLMGTETGFKARILAMAMKSFWEIAGSSTPAADRAPNRLFIAGYSRGGAAAVEACHILKDAGIPVHCLMLLDAVERTQTVSKTVVPANVRYCFHARRDPAAASRQSFGNCSTTTETGVAYTERSFFCTHGGVGGCPWTTAAEGGFISEWTDGWALGAKVMDTAFRVQTGVPLSPLRMVQSTRVTPAQDAIGSQESLFWMRANLGRAKFGVGDFPAQSQFGRIA